MWHPNIERYIQGFDVLHVMPPAARHQQSVSGAQFHLPRPRQPWKITFFYVWKSPVQATSGIWLRTRRSNKMEWRPGYLSGAQSVCLATLGEAYVWHWIWMSFDWCDKIKEETVCYTTCCHPKHVETGLWSLTASHTTPLIMNVYGERKS